MRLKIKIAPESNYLAYQRYTMYSGFCDQPQFFGRSIVDRQGVIKYRPYKYKHSLFRLQMKMAEFEISSFY